MPGVIVASVGAVGLVRRGVGRHPLALVSAVVIWTSVAIALYSGRAGPIAVIFPIVVIALAVARPAAAKELLALLRASRRDKGAVAASLVVGLFAALCLYLFTAYRRQSSALVFATDLDGLSPGLQITGLFGFAGLNSISEEVIWRGSLLSRQSSRLILLASCVSFGIAHYNGVPWGWAGVGMATGYGVAQAFLYLRFGLLSAVLSHLLVDLSIGVLLLGDRL